LFAAMCVIWGLPYLFIRVAVEHITPGTLVVLRTGIAAVILLPIALIRGHVRPVLARWRPLLLFAVVELMIPWLLLSDAERKLNSSTAGLLVAAVPLIGAVIARLSPSAERTSRNQVAGLLVGLIGVASLVGLDFGHLNLYSVAQIAVVAVGYALGPVLLSRWLSDLPALGVMSVSLTVTAVGYSPFLIFQPPTDVSAKVAASVLVLAVVCSAAAFLLFFELIAAIGPSRATVITYVNPAVAVALGVSILGDRLTIGMLIGFPLILIGSVLAARQDRPDRPEHENVDADPVAVP
jgi:drug/metabolite transporter (DMT)-like permease